MLDAFLSVMYRQEKTANVRDQMAEDMAGLPEDLLHKIASGQEKLAFSCDDNSWISKFKDTPLYAQALQLEEQQLELDIQRQARNIAESEQNAAERAQNQEQYVLEDQIRLKRRMLELQLAQAELQAMGGGAQTPPMEEPQGQPPGPAAGATTPAVEKTTEEKMKLSYATALMKASLEKADGGKPSLQVKVSQQLEFDKMKFKLAGQGDLASFMVGGVPGIIANQKAQTAGYNEPVQAGLRGLGGAALGALPGIVGSAALAEHSPIASGLLGTAGVLGAYGGYKALTHKYTKPAAKESRKEAGVLGTALQGLRGAGGFLSKAAPLAMNAAEHGGLSGLGSALKPIASHGIGLAANFAKANPLAAGAIGAGALGTAALGGAAADRVVR